MSIALLGYLESHSGTTGSTNEGSFSWPFTVAGTPEGAVVFVFQVGAGAADGDYCTGVTYGGASLTALNSGNYVADAVGEPGSVKAYFLGNNVPQGNVTVTVNRTNNAVEMWAVVCIVSATGTTCTTAGLQTATNDGGSWGGFTINDGSPGANSLRVMGVYNGNNTVYSGATGTTTATSIRIDFGNYTCGLYVETFASEGSTSIALISPTTSDIAAIGFAITEIPIGPTGRTYVKAGGSMVLKPTKVRIGGTQVEKPLKVKV